MKRKCDQCDKQATHHSVEIIKGDKIEKHLCDMHAEEAGMAIKTGHTTINELLTNVVKAHSGATAEATDLVCEECGLSFSQFRQNSLLGCPQCYKAFESQLAPLLERAHEGATHHIGKSPHRAGLNEMRQQKLLRMRRQLTEAVGSEDYERAAKLRDQIRRNEENVS